MNNHSKSPLSFVGGIHGCFIGMGLGTLFGLQIEYTSDGIVFGSLFGSTTGALLGHLVQIQFD